MPKYKVNSPFFLKGVYYMEGETCVSEKPLSDVYTKPASKKGVPMATLEDGEKRAGPKPQEE